MSTRIPGLHDDLDADVPMVDLTKSSPSPPPVGPVMKLFPLPQRPLKDIPIKTRVAAGSPSSSLHHVPVQRTSDVRTGKTDLHNSTGLPKDTPQLAFPDAANEEDANPSKRFKTSDSELWRLRVGNLRSRVTKNDIKYLFRDYQMYVSYASAMLYVRIG